MMAVNTREVAKKAVRDQITKSALARFQTQGFDETTIDEVAADVGMSSRTFFRYFSSKEDVVLQPHKMFAQKFLHVFAQELKTRELWSALAMALKTTLVICAEDDPLRTGLAIQRLVQETPALLARQLEAFEHLQLEVVKLYVSKNTDNTLNHLTVNAIVRSAFACFQAVHSNGAEGSDSESAKLLDLMSDIRPKVLSA